MRHRGQIAHIAVREALRKGELVRQPCEPCVQSGRESTGRIEAHHPDYSRPLDVRWLCTMHHRWLHQYGEEAVA